MATKVFVGNLSFSTTIDTLKKEFGAAGEVIDANIISRGPRSLGYGFVELANVEAAEKAVSLLHHKDLDGRVINVEIARPRAEGEEKAEGEADDAEKPRKRRQRKPRAPEGEGEAAATDAATTSTSTSTKPAGRGPRRRYSRQDGEQAGGDEQPRPRVRRTYRPREEGADGEAQTQPQEGGARRGGRGRGRGGAPRTFQPKGYRKVATNGEAPQTSEAGPSTSAPKPRRVRQPKTPVKRQEDRIPSETTLFVANLPFATTDDQLKALFAKAAPVTAAHVVTRKNGKSKGFGFVEFGTKEDQEAGLKAVDGSEIEGRKLNVKVALKAPPTDGAGASGATSDATPAAEPAKTAETKAESKAPEAGEKEKDKASA